MATAELDALSLALNRSPDTFFAVADALPMFIFLANTEGSATYLNRSYRNYLGLGRSAPREAFQQAVHPEDLPEIEQAWIAAAHSRRPYEATARLRSVHEDASYRWFKIRAVPMVKSGEISAWMGVIADIDDERRANENLRFVLDASTAFNTAATAEDIVQQFASLAVQRFADWAIAILKGDDGLKLVALEHKDMTRVQRVREFAEIYPVQDDGEFWNLMQTRETHLFSEITDEMLEQRARDPEHLEMLLGMQMRSAIAAPLLADGQLFGGIVTYVGPGRRAFTREDADVVKLLADRAGVAIATRRAVLEEQRVRRRLQFIGRATQIVYESLDPAATFRELTQLLVDTFADFASALRLENDGVVRVIATAHKDSSKEPLTEAFVGVRAFNPAAERKFVEALQSRKTIELQDLDPEQIAKTTWPYLAPDLRALSARAAVTVPLHSRGKLYGALIAYLDSRTNFSREEVQVLTEIGKHASVAMENAEVFERERHIAETLQDSLLPPSLPRFDDMHFDAVYLPSAKDSQVGGDWYDAFVLEDGSVVVSAGDVTGRGAYAAVVMGKVRHLLAIAPSYDRDPARILDTVESVLRRRYPEEIVTAFLGIIDPTHSTMRYAGAGHPPPLLRRAKGVEELQCDGLPLGIRHIAEPAESSDIDLTGARMLVFYTDGLTEATRDVVQGYGRLHNVVKSDAVLHTHSPARFIENSVLLQPADDDVAVLTISFEPPVRWSFDAESAKAAQDARGEFVRYLRENSNDVAQVESAELVFGELVGNVVRHAPGPIDVDLQWNGEFPELHVIDRGKKFKFGNDLPADALAESGRGLFIVRALSESVAIEHIEGYGNHVTVRLPVTKR